MSRNASVRDITGVAPLAGVVLCGGRSARMRADKALLEVEGRPLVLRVAARVARVADPVILAIGTRGRLGSLGYLEVADERPGDGPLAGLVAGLAASPHELVAAVGVDMPFVSPELLSFLAALHQDEDAVVPISAGGPEPLHAVYARSALPALRQGLGEGVLSLRLLLKRLRVREIGESQCRRVDPSGRFALNINRPEDLAGLSRDYGDRD